MLSITAKQIFVNTMEKMLQRPVEGMDIIDKSASLVNFQEGEYLHRAGEPANRVFFLITGLCRYFYITQQGKEFNKSFVKEHQFCGAIHYTKQPEQCRYNIQALEDTVCIAIPSKTLYELYESFHYWCIVGRISMEMLAIKKERREAEFLLDSAEERYRRFLEENPGVSSRINQLHIASYLGITNVALSRIRKKMKDAEVKLPK